MRPAASVPSRLERRRSPAATRDGQHAAQASFRCICPVSGDRLASCKGECGCRCRMTGSLLAAAARRELHGPQKPGNRRRQLRRVRRRGLPRLEQPTKPPRVGPRLQHSHRVIVDGPKLEHGHGAMPTRRAGREPAGHGRLTAGRLFAGMSLSRPSRRMLRWLSSNRMHCSGVPSIRRWNHAKGKPIEGAAMRACSIAGGPALIHKPDRQFVPAKAINSSFVGR